MKNKIFKSLCLITILISALSNSIPIAKAGQNDSQLVYERVTGVYYYQKDNKTGATMTGNVTKYIVNNQLAYCIEPMQKITTKTYHSTTDWSVTKLTKEQQHYIELVGYYGYEYPTHRNDRYFLASQKIIWEYLKDMEVKYTTELNGGNEVDVSKEINEVLNLVNSHNDLPSFGKNGSTTLPANGSITLTDAYGLLNQFKITSTTSGVKASINNNDLSIKVGNGSEDNQIINFEKKSYDNKTSLVYYNGDSQKLALLRISTPLNFGFTVNVKFGDFEINKTGETVIYENGTLRYENIKMSNVVFGIYAGEDIYDFDTLLYSKDDLITKVTTNNNGIATYKLPAGKFYFKELSNGGKHKLDDKTYSFEMKSGPYGGTLEKQTFNVNNELPKGKLHFQKIDADTKKPLANTEIEIYNDNDTLVYRGITDKDGYIDIELPTGSYYLIETKTSNEDYILSSDKLEFEITEDGQTIDVTMENDKIIEVPKTGVSEFGNIISLVFIVSGVIILIYDKKKKK